MSAENIPLLELLFGVDIYSGQGYPNLPQLEAEGHSFILSKATGEGDYVNPYWIKNREETRKTSMIFGTYDWVEPQSGNSGASDAANYWRVINSPGPLLPGEFVTVDFETPDWWKGPEGHNIEGFMREYLYTLWDLAQQPIGIYTATYFLQETGAVGWDWLSDQRFFYWQAAPGSVAMMPDNSFWPATSPPFSRTVLHQHQWHAHSPAVQMEFDRNRFWGTREELLTFGKPGTPAGGQGEVQEPAAGKVAWYINAEGNPIFVWNPGGHTKKIRGVDIANLGMTVESLTEPGTLVGISIFNGETQPWHTFPDPEVQAKKVFLTGGNPEDITPVYTGSPGDYFDRPKPEEYVPEEGKKP